MFDSNYILSKTFFQLKMYDKALYHMEQVNYDPLHRGINSELARIYQAKGDYKSAISYYRKDLNYLDSLFPASGSKEWIDSLNKEYDRIEKIIQELEAKI